MHLFSTTYEATFYSYTVLITCHLFNNVLAQYPCSGTDTFVKVSGYIPSRENQLLLYSSPGRTVTKECYQRCKGSTDCLGFFVNYTAYACYRVVIPSGDTTTPDGNYGYPYHGNVSETNYFERTCLNGVPSKCRLLKRWVIERAPNFELVGSGDVTYSAETKELCMQYCLQETRFACRSAEYTYSLKKCVLSHEDRHTQTDSYRATPLGVDYLENQCIDPETGETCPFEEHKNRTVYYRDLEFTKLTLNECHDKCVNETNFICRALTYLPDTASGTGISVCWLHSDDTISVGPRALKPLQGAVYMERVPCLDLQVICSERAINVTLHTLEQFRGRIYVREHSDTCDAKGTGGYITSLIIPISGSGLDNQCGIMVINSIGGETNQTLMSTVIVIQHNPIIQRRGDRVVKIGCLLDSKFSENVTVTAGIIVTGSESGEGTIYYNTTSSVPPTVRIRIVDPDSGNPDIKETELGQTLQFRIDVIPDNGPFDIRAGHLVATSSDGSESILLLDERGCPPDPVTFPAFQKADPHSNSLVANFHAFKFPNSPVVRFNVMVQFCPGACSPTNCGNGIVAYGRRKREIVNATLYQEMPLQTAIVVHGPDLVPSSLLATPDSNSKIIVGVEDVPGSVCVYYGAIIGLVIAWILLQFFILIGCYMVVRERYKRKRDDDNSMQHKLEDDFNGFDNSRHVHWADQLN